MIEPRRFTLMNGSGEELDLLTKDLFFHDPKGLGYERDDDYRRIGNRWVIVSQHFSQTPITGTIAFLVNENATLSEGQSILETPYIEYFRFIKFTQDYPLTLLYKPEATNPVVPANRRLVRLSKVEKTEINKYGYLDINIELLPLTPWFRPRVDTDSSTVQQGWDWHWILGSNQNSIKWGGTESTLSISSDSRMDSPCRLTLNGPATNPKWEHYVNGSLYATGQVNVTVGSNQKLVIDNTKDPYSILVYNSNGTVASNAYQKSVFETARFLNLQYGSNVVKISNVQGTTMLEAMIYYESV